MVKTDFKSVDEYIATFPKTWRSAARPIGPGREFVFFAQSPG
jgi:hypothetical protein